MRWVFTFAIILCTVCWAFSQNEQAPLIEKEISYKDWTYKSIRTDEHVNLRNFTKDKKLVMVVYFAPWCPNWRHDAPMLQRLYDKYKASGLDIIAVGLYDPVASMKTSLDALKITFPAVYESADRAAKQTSKHYDYRRSTGDTRGWGSPWYIFLTPRSIEKQGDLLVKKTFVINGELMPAEGESFIRNHLGLPAVETKAALAKHNEIEVCDPYVKTLNLKKP